MELKPDELKKYNAQYPMPKPRQGRFAPHGQFFLCETDEQVAQLEAAGWGTNPLAFDKPYPPEDAVLVEKWKQVKLTGDAIGVAPVNAAALQAEVERLTAELAAAKASKGGRPRKMEA